MECAADLDRPLPKSIFRIKATAVGRVFPNTRQFYSPKTID